ncbi:DNA-binding domain-containing protein [Vibrio sp. FNV 38]|nr:DNA-binding domain-containing protein [Vibrio sp. FNV 38]
MELAQLQKKFAKALHYQAQGNDCNIVSNHFSADERIQIYRNNFIISLTDVLHATYPMVALLVGEECFNQLARRHILTNPLSKGEVSDYGEHFDQTLLAFPNVIEAAPYIGDVALFEWALDCAYHLINTPNVGHVLPIQHLIHLHPEEQSKVVFHLYPWVQLVSSSYALFDLFHAIQSNCFDQLELNRPQQGVIHACSNGDRIPIVLQSEAYQLLKEVHCYSPLGQINPALLSHLNFLMEKGLIAGFTIENDERTSL